MTYLPAWVALEGRPRRGTGYWCRHCLELPEGAKFVTLERVPFEQYKHMPACLVPLAQAAAIALLGPADKSDL